MLENIPFQGYSIKRKLTSFYYGDLYQIENDNEVRLMLYRLFPDDSQFRIALLRFCDNSEEKILQHFDPIFQDLVTNICFLKEISETGLISCFEVSSRNYSIRPGFELFVMLENVIPLSIYLKSNVLLIKDILNISKILCHTLKVWYEKFPGSFWNISEDNIFVNKNGEFLIGRFTFGDYRLNTVPIQDGISNYLPAPEVKSGQIPDMKSDIYSVGLIIYRLLNNCLNPFLSIDSDFENFEDLIKNIYLNKKFPTPYNSTKHLDRFLKESCAFKPKSRFKNFFEMEKELVKVISNTDSQMFEKVAVQL